MPKIVAISDDMSKFLADGLNALGDLYVEPRRRFDDCHAELRKERDTDLLITNVPPRGTCERRGYDHSVRTVRETIEDLKIPVIIYSGIDDDKLMMLNSVPAIVHLKGPKWADQRVLDAATAIARHWFPMSPTERVDFMDETIRLFHQEAARTDFVNTDPEIVLVERFRILDARELDDRWAMSEMIREMCGVKLQRPSYL
jgi:hypothetical protein